MKQPELGSRITELRKKHNLTQEELVDLCNVSVRTIQRIESGEVIPRTSTVRVILDALNEDFDRFKKSFSKGNLNMDLQLTENWLQMAWVSGIIYFVIGFAEVSMDYNMLDRSTFDFSNTAYISVKLVSIVSYFFFIGGFIKLAEYFDIQILKVSSVLLIAITGVIAGYDIHSLYYHYPTDIELWMRPVQSISLGVSAIIFGLGIFRLQNEMGRLAQAAGALEIIIGFCLAIVILFFVGLLLVIPTIIIEILLLYRAYEFFKKQREEAF